MRKFFSRFRGFIIRSLNFRAEGTSPTSSNANNAGRHEDNNVAGTSHGGSRAAGQHLDTANTAGLESGPKFSALESLPAELRSHILLCLSDLEALQAAVHASPILRQQYLADRKILLGKHLKTTLGDRVFVDAYAAHTSALLRPPHGTLSMKTISQFVNTYREALSGPPDALLDECSADDLIGMTSFYQSTIRPLLRQLPGSFLHQFLPDDASLLEIRLSNTERARMMRALYRFQTWCNLFGIGSDRRAAYYRVEPTEILRLFFGIFDPWEVEEVACIHIILLDQYKQLFDDTKWDLHRENPRFRDWVHLHTPDGSFDLDNEILRDFLRDGALSRGLEFYRDVSGIADHEELVQTMQRMMAGGPNSITDTLSFFTQDDRRRQHPSDHDRVERARQKLPFSGDGQDGPPLTWVMIWRGKYSNRYGEIIPDSLKSWGYVFWDVNRLVSTGAKDVLLRTWTAEYPRDDAAD